MLYFVYYKNIFMKYIRRCKECTEHMTNIADVDVVDTLTHMNIHTLIHMNIIMITDMTTIIAMEIAAVDMITNMHTTTNAVADTITDIIMTMITNVDVAADAADMNR